LELYGLVHYSSRALLGIEKEAEKERKGKSVVKIRRGTRDMGRNRIFGVLCNDAVFSTMKHDVEHLAACLMYA
jgi:hypothetical protein